MVTFSEQTSPTAGGRNPSRNTNDNKLTKIILIVAIAFVILGGGIYLLRVKGISLGSGEDRYYAVFLTNDQVYFGKITKSTSREVVLTDIYYLIIRRPLQAQVPEGSPSARPRPEYRLIKLGGELHGPEDEMRINRDQILFIEPLKKDGKVVQAILQSKNKPQE